MNKVKCANGHFYNADKYQLCPICGDESAVTLEKKVVSRAVDALSKTEPLLPNTGRRTCEPVSASDVSTNMDEVVPTELILREEALHHEEESPLTEEPRFEEAPPSKETPHSGAVRFPNETAIKEKSAPAEHTAAATAEKDRQSSYAGIRSSSSLSQAVAGTGSKDISALPKTVSYYDTDDADPPVGWVVCIKGPYLGRAFECKVGRNRFGRLPDYEICLLEDTTVTRESHAILIYEPTQKQFFLQAGTGDGLAYLNGKVLFTHEELHPYDRIALGNSEFVFLPLCGERFTWDEYIAKG